MRNRRHILRDHLVHVIPHLRVDGVYSLVNTLVLELYSRYQHTVIHETPLDEPVSTLVAQLGANGADVLQTDEITPELLDAGEYTGGLFYNLQGHHPDLGAVLPSVYYSYGLYDPQVKTDLVIPCSDYAAKIGRHGEQLDLDSSLTVAPMIGARSMRRLKLRAKSNKYTVGIITSGTPGKYPGKQVMELLGKLPDDIVVYLTTLPKYTHPGVELAIAARKERNAVVGCVLRPMAGLSYLLHLDVLVHATHTTNHEPYGRLVVEAAAAGIPVICEQRGVFEKTAEHEWNTLVYKTTDEVIAHIARLRADEALRSRLIANGQLWASWHDVSVHIGKFKRLLREIGI